MYRLEFTPGECAVMEATILDQSTGEWMEDNVVVPEGPMKGSYYDPRLSPYFPPLWDLFMQAWVREMAVVAGPQIGKTLFGQGFLARRGVERPGPRQIALPDEDLTEDWFGKKIIPLFENSPKLKRYIASERNAVVKTEIALKNGTTFTGRWMGSLSKRASLSVLDGLGDEPDMFPAGAHKDFVERFNTFSTLYKLLWIGKPIGYDGESFIWDEFNRADVRVRWAARCPACGTYQVMQFENIKVPEGMRDPAEIRLNKAAWYECCHCEWRWTDQIRNRAVRDGRLEFDKEVDRPIKIGVHIPSWNSRWVSLSSVMADWFAAQGDPDKLKSWWNGFAAQPANVIASESNEERLEQLMVPELPPLVVPGEAQAITLSTDMQKDHFFYSTCAHWVDPTGQDDGSEEWVIDQGKIATFKELHELIFQSRFRRDGKRSEFLGVWRAGLDTGGGKNEWEDETRTMQAYEWLLRQRPGVVFGTKGMSRKTPGYHVRLGNPMQQLPNGKKLKRPMRLHFIDTDAFKDLFFWRLSDEARDEEGRWLEPIHFHAKTPPEYFYQLCSEKKVLQKGTYIWKRIRANHWLDCMIGHLAMAHWQWSPSLKAMVAADMAARAAAKTQQTAQGAKKYNPYTGKEM